MSKLSVALRRSPWAGVEAVGGVMLSVAPFLPWFRIEGHALNGLDNFQTRSGLGHSPGTPMLAIGEVVLVVAVATIVRPGRWGFAFAALAAALVGVLAVGWGWLTIRAYVDFEGGGDMREPGLWLASAGAVVSMAASVIAAVRRRRNQ